MIQTASMIDSVNPATGEVIARHEMMTAQRTVGAISKAHNAFQGRRNEPLRARAEMMRRFAQLLRDRIDHYARLISLEMGKPIVEARAEIEKCAVTCDYYADNARDFLDDESAPSDSLHSLVSFEPLGVVLAIMPWNYPFWQVIRFAAPALMAGNAALLKHASNVTGCSLELELAFVEAGFPDGLFGSLVVPSAQVSRIIADSRVAAVTLTGSDIAGRKVAALAGKYLKKSVLELGGSDPFIVLRDADIDQAARTAVRARFQNTGQSCIAAKRFIVDNRVAEDFELRVIEYTRALRVGDPLDPQTEVGPIARADLREELERQMQESVLQGASIAAGGKRVDRPGYFLEPTILTHCTPSMTVCREETFGPLGVIMRVPDDDAAIGIANQTRYGLGAALWSNDAERADRLARQLECGGVFINGMTHSDARLPFGGIKDSGYGRELSSFGIREFVNVKTLWR